MEEHLVPINKIDIVDSFSVKRYLNTLKLKDLRDSRIDQELLQIAPHHQDSEQEKFTLGDSRNIVNKNIVASVVSHPC